MRSPMIYLAIAIAVASNLHAQWPAYPVGKIPRNADGKPNMDAPTPMTADGHPDLSGVWEFKNPPSTPTPGAPTTPATGFGQGPRPGVINQFWNIGSSIKGGLPFQPLAAELRKSRIAENSKSNPDALCLPMGLMQLNTHPQPRKMIQTPGVIVMLYEANTGIRQIFTDGRPLPSPDVQPWWYGYSVGHWDGDTLVVETTGFRDDVWLDVEGSPLTNAGKMIERFRRPNYGTLEIDVTVDDPKSYTKPWTVKIGQRLMPEAELIEFICNENDRSAGHMVGR